MIFSDKVPIQNFEMCLSLIYLKVELKIDFSCL